MDRDLAIVSEMTARMTMVAVEHLDTQLNVMAWLEEYVEPCDDFHFLHGAGACNGPLSRQFIFLT